MSAVALAVAWVGRLALSGVRANGALALVFLRTLRQAHRLRRRELVRCVAHYGYDSLPLTLLVAAVVGATVVLQTTIYVQRFGARAVFGWAAGYSVIWEFGPLLMGLMMCARIGARNAAELASLTVGGQIEGLRGIALDPYAILIAPRIIATVVSVALLSSVAFVTAIGLEALAARFMLALPQGVFFESFAQRLSGRDLLGGLAKAFAFGLAISLISTVAGLSAKGGARGVGRSAGASVVFGTAAIFSLDMLLTPALARLLS